MVSKTKKGEVSLTNEWVVKLYQKLERDNISVPSFAEETGIPSARIYKWKQEGTSPKSLDEQKIKEWLNGETSKTKQQKLSGPVDISLQDYINKIEEHNKFLQKVIESGLVDIKQALSVNFASLHESQDSAIVYQKAWIEKIARNEGGNDADKVQAVRDEMDTIIAAQTRPS